MANKQRQREAGTGAFEFTLTAAKVVSIGDCMGNASNVAVPASDYTYGGGGTYASLAIAQAAFAAAFLGVAREASRATDARTTEVIDSSGVFEFDCASATFEVGDLVGMAGNATPTPDALENQKVVAVDSPAKAIGRVWKRGTSVTTVLVKIGSKVINGGINGGGSVYSVTFNVAAAEIVGSADVITGFVPGHRFVLEALDVYVTSALVGSSKTVTLNPEIDTVNVTGAVAVVASASAALGTRVAGSAPTAGNTGGATSVIDIESSAVTAFTGGEMAITLRIRNLDA